MSDIIKNAMDKDAAIVLCGIEDMLETIFVRAILIYKKIPFYHVNAIYYGDTDKKRTATSRSFTKLFDSIPEHHRPDNKNQVIYPCIFESRPQSKLPLLQGVDMISLYLDERFPTPPIFHFSPHVKAIQKTRCAIFADHVLNNVDDLIFNQNKEEATREIMEFVASVDYLLSETTNYIADSTGKDDLNIFDIYMLCLLRFLSLKGLELKQSPNTETTRSFYQTHKDTPAIKQAFFSAEHSFDGYD